MVIQLLMRMLVKDHNKRADWNEVFLFEINENGEMWKSKGESDTFSKNGSLIATKASTTITEDSRTLSSQKLEQKWSG